MSAQLKQKPSLILSRRIHAAPEKIYAAWTDPEKIARWWGPSNAAETLRAETDVRVGGRFRIAFRDTDGDTHDVSGIYQEVVPNRRLVFSWAWITTPDRESQVTLTFEPDGAATNFTLLHEHFYDVAARDAHQAGWGGALDKLKALFDLAPARIVEAGAMIFAGYLTHYNAPGGDIGAQWMAFAPRISAIPGKIGNVAYGVMRGTPDGFDYLAGVEVSDADAAQSFDIMRAAPHAYAVFTHPGHTSEIRATMDQIHAHEVWTTGLAPERNAEFFERYGEGFDPVDGRGDIEIWIPLQGK
jgi:uncharacterized protein YndB with AHSA1/START domain/predicted transcriptional regulator YdeE